jgi:hypothetical protein
VTTLAEALARLEDAVARLEAAAERNLARAATSRQVAGEVAERVDNALLKLDRALGEDG